MRILLILAYLDPNLGSSLLQIILASLLAVGVTVRLFWSKIKGLIGKRNSKADQESNDEDL